MGKPVEAYRVYFDAAVFCVGWHKVAEEGERVGGDDSNERSTDTEFIIGR